MKLLYIANARIPTDRANGKQIIEMCEALALGGAELTLVVPDRSNSNPLNNLDVFKYYQIERIFKIKYIKVIDTFATKMPLVISFQLLNLSFTINCLRYILDNRPIFTRSKLVGTLLALFGKKVVFEAHDSAYDHLFNRISARLFKTVISISKSIDSSWKNLGAKTKYLPDGLSSRWLVSIDKSEARKQVNLSTKKPLIMYTGTLTNWKGSETLIKASQLDENLAFYSVGRVEVTETGKLQLIEHESGQKVRHWQDAADVLVIPNSAKYKKGREDTSPLKLFEYMASGRPILASDVPAIREIVDDSMVTFFEPDNPEDLIKKAKWILNHPQEVDKKAKKAKQEVVKYTWNNRAKKLIDAFGYGS